MAPHHLTISALTPEADGLSASWSDGAVSSWPWPWLRDHSTDPATLHEATNQRLLDAHDLDLDIKPKSVKMEGAAVVVEWATRGAPSTLPVAFLARFRTPCAPDPHSLSNVVTPVIWDSRVLGHQAPSVPYADIMTTDSGLAQYLTLVARYGFALATNTPPTSPATSSLCTRVSYIRETIFGGFWEFSANGSHADTAYSNLRLPGHTDGTYSHDAPGLQMLHCLEFEGTGGESTVVDGFRIAEEIRRRDPGSYEVLSKVHVPGRYLGDGHSLLSSRPVLRHVNGKLVQVSFNNSDRAPFLLPAAEQLAFYKAISLFSRLAADPQFQWRHVLRPGEAMLFDNWRVLHGREAFGGKRTLCGAYFNREEFEGRLRMLGGEAAKL